MLSILIEGEIGDFFFEIQEGIFGPKLQCSFQKILHKLLVRLCFREKWAMFSCLYYFPDFVDHTV